MLSFDDLFSLTIFCVVIIFGIVVIVEVCGIFSLYICIGIGNCFFWVDIGVFKGVVGGVGAMGRKGLGVVLSGGMLMCVVGVAVIIVVVLVEVLLEKEFISVGMLIRIIFLWLNGIFLLSIIFFKMLWYENEWGNWFLVLLYSVRRFFIRILYWFFVLGLSE